MSAQTGVETPRGPASQRLGDRVRYRVDRFRAEPNPLWMREMRQSARLLRTPIILMVLAALITMVMASLGGLLTGQSSPAEVGSTMFHVFFSLAFFVVTLVGPALAANSIASEREGQTWEAVLLTGMRPERIASGKFLSAFTAIAMYIVMLAPVGALPFLFGGVTPLDVLIAFVLLFLIALLAVAFGLAVSAKMESLRGALLVTLLVAVPLSGAVFGFFGMGGSVVAHAVWREVPGELPVWLPVAYGLAPFGVEYVVYLVVLPLCAVALPAWLLYEITRCNLTSVTDDRSVGLKRWYAVAAVVLGAAAGIPLFAVDTHDHDAALIVGMVCYCFFVIFCCFLFAGEAIGPSRRVKLMLAKAGVWRRFIAPGVVPTARLQLIFTVGALTGLAVVGSAWIHLQKTPSVDEQTERIAIFTAYALGFAVFSIGLTAWLRARFGSAAAPRVLLLVTLFLLTTGPWILAAISGVSAHGSSSGSLSLAVAAPSPVYVFMALEQVGRPDPGVAIPVSIGASLVYGVLGGVLVMLAAARCRTIIREHERLLAAADRRLAEADARAAAEREQQRQAALEALARPGDEPPEKPAPDDATE